MFDIYHVNSLYLNWEQYISCKQPVAEVPALTPTAGPAEIVCVPKSIALLVELILWHTEVATPTTPEAVALPQPETEPVHPGGRIEGYTPSAL